MVCANDISFDGMIDVSIPPSISIRMTDLGIRKTQRIAVYLRDLFKAEIRGNIDEVFMPTWNLDLLEECRYAAIVIARACRNQRESRTDIDAIFF